MNYEDIVIKSEYPGSDEDQDLLAEIREELAKARNMAADQEIVEPPNNIKVEKMDSNPLSGSMETAGFNTEHNFEAANSKSVDSFIIYEIKEEPLKNSTTPISDDLICVQPKEKASKKQFSNNTISQLPSRYTKLSITKRKRNHKTQRNSPPPLLKPLALEKNKSKLKSSRGSKQKRRKRQVSSTKQVTSINGSDQSTNSKSLSENVVPKTGVNLKSNKNVAGRLTPSIKKISLSHKKTLLSSSSECEKICECSFYPQKGADVHTKLELKDFFERMFEKTRQLSIERRQMVKMELLKAVCTAEEEVEAGMFCEKCYRVKANATKELLELVKH